MKKQKRILILKLVMVLLAVSLVALPACSRKKEQPGTPAANPYSADVIFLKLKKQVEQNPKDADAWYGLADLYYQNSIYDRAADAYKKVVELRPHDGYSWLKMGVSYDRLNKPKEAANAYEHAVKYMHGYAVAYNNLGVAYGKLGESAREIAAFKKAVKLRKGYATARYNLGYAYVKKGDKKAAMEQYNALKDIDEGAADTLMQKIKGESTASE